MARKTWAHGRYCFCSAAQVHNAHVPEPHNDRPSTRRGGQYLRVSKDASGRARSVDEQEADNRRDAAAEGVEMVRTYRDTDRSASRYARRAREDYAVLLRDIEAGAIDVLYLWEPSRGSRKVSEWVVLIELAEAHGVVFRVTSHGRTYNPAKPRDRKSLLEDAVSSEFASGETSERVQRAFDASAAAGTPSGKPAYGYRREYDAHSGRLLAQVPDEVTAPIVAEIARRVLAGDTLARIAADLNDRGVPTPQMVIDTRLGRATFGKARLWNGIKVRKVVSTPSVAGYRVHQSAVHTTADWEPIVPPAGHAALLKILADPRRLWHRGTAPRHLLSGIATCALCGAAMRPFMNRGRLSYACGGQRKGHVVRRADMVDAMVAVYVVTVLEDPELLERVARAKAGEERQVSDAARELVDLEAQLARFEESAAAARGMEAASFARVVARLVEQIEAAQERMGRSSGLPQIVLDAAGPDAAQVWDDHVDDILWRRQIVRALVRVVVHPSTRPRGRRGFDIGSVEITPRWVQPGTA
jgi:site-specific DNA recombinase